MLTYWDIYHWQQNFTGDKGSSWVLWGYKTSEEDAQVELAKLALQHGGQWRIVKEE